MTYAQEILEPLAKSASLGLSRKAMARMIIRYYEECGGMPIDGVERIRAERLRQMKEEGWTSLHDDAHTDGQLAAAAACYAVPERAVANSLWPWEIRFWKPCPEDRIHELEKAGALIAAEIDRLLRIKDADTEVTE